MGWSAAWAVVTGLLPHVLHHAGPLAGAALLAGTGGSLLFGALGLVLAVPFLRRLHTRFGSWHAPAIALALFATVFSISTFLIGPSISGEEEATPSNTPAPLERDTQGHEQHH